MRCRTFHDTPQSSCALPLSKSSPYEHAGDRPPSMVRQLFGVCFCFHPCLTGPRIMGGFGGMSGCIGLLSDLKISCESVRGYLASCRAIFLFAFPNCSLLLPFRLPFFFFPSAHHACFTPKIMETAHRYQCPPTYVGSCASSAEPHEYLESTSDHPQAFLPPPVVFPSFLQLMPGGRLQGNISQVFQIAANRSVSRTDYYVYSSYEKLDARKYS